MKSAANEFFQVFWKKYKFMHFEMYKIIFFFPRKKKYLKKKGVPTLPKIFRQLPENTFFYLALSHFHKTRVYFRIS